MNSIHSMTKSVRVLSGPLDGNERKAFNATKSDCDYGQSELEILRAQKSEWDQCKRELDLLRSQKSEWNYCKKKLEDCNQELVILRSGISKIGIVILWASLIHQNKAVTLVYRRYGMRNSD